MLSWARNEMPWPMAPSSQPAATHRATGRRQASTATNGRKNTAWGSVITATSATRANPTSPARVRGRANNSHGIRYIRYECTLATLPRVSNRVNGNNTGMRARATRLGHHDTTARLNANTSTEIPATTAQASTVSPLAHQDVGSRCTTSQDAMRGIRCW